MTFYMPTKNADDWKYGLAQPDKQWVAGYSAYALAHVWENAKGFPTEVQTAFVDTVFENCELLLALPEHKVAMPVKGADSQNDLFVLAKLVSAELATITVEGKVSEPFGQRLAEWHRDSDNKTARLQAILDIIGLPHDIPDTTRYQLLHRMASAVIEAQRFNAKHALLLVHSFSAGDAHYDDYVTFLALYGIQRHAYQKLWKLTTVHDIELYATWVRGDKRYLQVQEK